MKPRAEAIVQKISKHNCFKNQKIYVKYPESGMAKLLQMNEILVTGKAINQMIRTDKF